MPAVHGNSLGFQKRAHADVSCPCPPFLLPCRWSPWRPTLLRARRRPPPSPAPPCSACWAPRCAAQFCTLLLGCCLQLASSSMLFFPVCTKMLPTLALPTLHRLPCSLSCLLALCAVPHVADGQPRQEGQQQAQAPGSQHLRGERGQAAQGWAVVVQQQRGAGRANRAGPAFGLPRAPVQRSHPNCGAWCGPDLSLTPCALSSPCALHIPAGGQDAGPAHAAAAAAHGERCCARHRGRGQRQQHQPRQAGEQRGRCWACGGEAKAGWRREGNKGGYRK